MDEPFSVEQTGDGCHQFSWGTASICEAWIDAPLAQALCDLLETTRQMETHAYSANPIAFLRATDAQRAAWVRFRNLVQGGSNAS